MNYPPEVIELATFQRKNEQLRERMMIDFDDELTLMGANNQRIAAAGRLNIVEMAGLREPSPATWTVDGLIPEGHISLLYGDGGQGKSYIAMAIAECIATGRPIAGRPTEKGRVLFIDYELSEDEQVRRAYQVARGLGLDAPPPGLDYLNPEGISLAEVAARLKDHNYSLLVLDSMGAAMRGDMESARDVVPVFHALKPLGTVLLVDHQPKRGSADKYSSMTAFGSVFKSNLARSVFQLQKGGASIDGGLLLTLRHKKCNFARLSEPIGLRAEFGHAFTVNVEEIPLDAEEGLGPDDRILNALATLAPATAAEIADTTQMPGSTVRGRLAELKKQGVVKPDGKRGRSIIYKLADVAVDEMNPKGESRSATNLDNEAKEFREFNRPIDD